MTDQLFSEATPATPAALTPPRRRSSGALLLVLAVVILLGAAGVAWIAWKGLVPMPEQVAGNLAAPVATPSPAVGAPAAGAAPQSAPVAAAPGTAVGQVDQLEARVAALSARLDALTLQAQAAAGNATRAEALLVAVAARRALDRGAPLNTLEDQLRLRFGDSQPHAVTTVIEAARQPVTLDQLVAGLDGLAPSLTAAPAAGSLWERMRNAVGDLFVIRHETAPSPKPEAQLARARLLLESGRTEDAIAEVQHLPGAAGAADWFTAARRYNDARRALDVLETAALIGQPAARATAGMTPAPASTTPTT